MNVHAFHGQGSSPSRMRYDCGNPDWITRYADWQNGFDNGTEKFVALGYSLGGSFIAELTNRPIAKRLAGIIVYESPVLTMLPAPVDCPVVVIWNDYEPRTLRRREQKAHSIKAWNRASDNVAHLLGGYRKHTRWIPRWPFIGQAWDVALNPMLAEWVAGLK